MNAYTTRGQARIQPRVIAAVMLAYPWVGASRAALERQRGYQAEAEVAWLLKHNGVTPQAGASFLSLLRQTIGATLVRVENVSRVPPNVAHCRKRPLRGECSAQWIDRHPLGAEEA